jgi:thioredoxin reductase
MTWDGPHPGATVKKRIKTRPRRRRNGLGVGVGLANQNGVAVRDHVDRTSEHIHDYVIVGAGPGGCQLAYFLHRDQRDYVVLESGEVGQFFTRYPRHRSLISNNKVHTGFTDRDKNLRWDWNSLLSDELDVVFTHYTGDYFPKADVLVRYLRDFADRYELNIRTGVRLTGVSRDPRTGVFTVHDQDGGAWRGRRLIMATGHNRPFTPDAPGIELAEQYADVSTDPADYADQRVIIVGKGNSGLETAQNLFQHAASLHVISPHPVRLAWTTHHVSDLRSVYTCALDSYQLKMQNTILDGRIESIERTDDGRLLLRFQYSHAHGQRWQLAADRVILCCGFRSDLSVFDASCRPQTCHEGRFPALTSAWESVNVPGLYFAGTIMQSRDYKRSFSGFIHGFRYNIRFLAAVFAERYHQQPITAEPVAAGPRELAALLISRAVSASSLFQMPAFLADVYLLDGGQPRLARDVPVEYALEMPGWRERPMLMMTLEYGHLPPGADPFNFERDPNDGSTSQFIHPVLRLYRDGEVIDTHHVPEDLENEWDKEVYVAPLREVLRRMLATAGLDVSAAPVPGEPVPAPR